MNVYIENDYISLSKKLASIIVAGIINKPNLSVAFPTGNTPMGFYKELSRIASKNKIDFSKLKVYELDEFVGVSKKDKRSNYLYFEKNILKPLKIKKANFKYFENRKSFKKFEKEIDVMILGLGKNGHIAYNEPGSSFYSKTREVALATSTKKTLLKQFKKATSKAYTIGISNIMNAKKIFLIANGKDKQEAIGNLLYGNINKNFPASFLRLHPDFNLIVDRDAIESLDEYKIRRSSFLFLDKQKLSKNKNIIVISPHPDDSAISCGGTLAKLSKDNKIYTFVLTSGWRALLNPPVSPFKKGRVYYKNPPLIPLFQRGKFSRIKEAKKEAKILGAIPSFFNLQFYDNPKTNFISDIKKVFKNIAKIKPDVILLPNKNDIHPTHRKSNFICLSAIFKYLKKYKASLDLWYYETPWGIFANNEFNASVLIDKRNLNTKLSAIFAHKSQISRNRYDIFAKEIAMVRAKIVNEQYLAGMGKQIKSKIEFLECFNIVKIS